MKRIPDVYRLSSFAAAFAASLIAFDAAAQAKPAPLPAPGSTRAATGPGTQTEDELYVGKRRSADAWCEDDCRSAAKPAAGLPRSGVSLPAAAGAAPSVAPRSPQGSDPAT
ncbi:MAG: hypothetical protein N2688_04775, partial [Burkholderiaceae bacterium]|nr:hypothetical protein [Burkholderiaceae bacterium]